MIAALAVLGLFGVAVLVGIVTSARRSVHDSAAAVEAWNLRAEQVRRDADSSPSSRTPGGAA